MTKRRFVMTLGAVLLTAAFLASFYQSTLIGWWRGEAKYQGRYTNSWRAEMRSYYVFDGFASLGHSDWTFVREPSRWEQWLGKLLPSSFSPKLDFHAPLQDGDPGAVLVLVELFRAPEINVRMIAASGLERIGPLARQAIPALLTAVNDADGEVAQAAWQALCAVDKSVAPEDRLRYLRRAGTGDDTSP